jgi:amidase
MRMAVHRIVDLTGIAGLAGCPQVNLPVAVIGEIPVGLSLIGWRGGDAALVGAACAIAHELPPGMMRE